MNCYMHIPSTRRIQQSKKKKNRLYKALILLADVCGISLDLDLEHTHVAVGNFFDLLIVYKKRRRRNYLFFMLNNFANMLFYNLSYY